MSRTLGSRWRKTLGGAAAVVAIGITATLGIYGDGGALLAILSPPGAGYDATAGDLYGSRGEAVTVTRASTQSCQDSSGTIRTVAVNKPCLRDGASLLVEPAGTNLLLRSAELDNASWTDANTAPTVTANSWDFGEGSNTGETLTDVQGASSSGRQQSVSTTTAGAYTYSCFTQSGTLPSVRFNLVVTGGTGTAACTFTDLTTTTQRKTCTITAGAGVTSIAPQVLVGAVAADVGSIKVGGCQLEAGSVATSYIPTAGATATRAAQTTTVATPAGLSRTEGCVCLNFTPSGWSTTNPLATTQAFVYGNAAGTARLAYLAGSETVYRANDNTSTTSIAAAFTAGVPRRYCTRWSAAQNLLRVYNVTDGTQSSGTTFTTFPAFDATLGLGNGGGSLQAIGHFDSIVFGKSFGACQ